MKAFMDSGASRDYLEICLNEEEIDKLPISGVCKKFYYIGSCGRKKKMLDILILPDNVIQFQPNDDWNQQEENYGEHL